LKRLNVRRVCAAAASDGARGTEPRTKGANSGTNDGASARIVSAVLTQFSVQIGIYEIPKYIYCAAIWWWRRRGPFSAATRDFSAPIRLRLTGTV
jgi:hypothetical protein